MANQARLGFSPVNGSGQPRKYTVASGYTPSNSCPGIAPGEIVKIVAADSTVAIQNVGDTGAVLGVVAAVSYIGTDGRRVYGGYIPAGHTYTGDVDVINPLAPYVWVWDQPDLDYMAALAVDSGTAQTEFQKVGANMELTATSSTSVDTVYKRSLRALSGTAATTATLPFRIMEISRGPAQDYGATSYLRVKCTLNAGFHAFYQATGV